LDPASRVDTLIAADPWSLAGIVVILLADAAGIWWAWRRDRRGVVFATLVAVQATVLLAVAAVRAPLPLDEEEFPVTNTIVQPMRLSLR
jgi:hypothetical protein